MTELLGQGVYDFIGDMASKLPYFEEVLNNMLDPGNHPAFTPWTDPVSGVKSYLLTQRVAQQQQSFYFTNRSMTQDGRWLWFYVAHPPGGNATRGRCLGVCDMVGGEVRWFPET